MLHKIYGWVRVGWGWDDNFFWPCTHGRCHTRSKAGVGWGGVAFLGLEYMVDATQDLRLGSGGVGWGDNVPWP